MLEQHIQNWYDQHAQEVMDFSKRLWELAETALLEYESCRLTAAFMEKYGFRVTTYNCIDSTKPSNTVVAERGSGHPVIGIIGEYDALPGLGQEAVPYPSPKEGNGHGCGHSLMAPSCGSAAIALSEAMEAAGLPGTVKFFACPAEETVEGKMHMARDGIFNGLDCCMAWHPKNVDLQVRENIQNSLCNMKVEFFGKAAHAASVPFEGRSALDACELMNVGVNYLREHVDPTTRMHYTYLAAGEKPNIVPAYAALHYFLRTKDMKYGYELLDRVKAIAEGAALMTGTTCKITVHVMVPGCIQISSFNDFFYEAMKKVPPLTYTEEELAFAKEMFKNVHGREPEPGETYLPTGIVKPTGKHVNAPVSTDAGCVTRLTPTSRLHGWGWVTGIPGHSWATVACSGHTIGLKAAVHAGMAVAQCGFDIAKDPSVIEGWRADLDRQLAKEGDIRPIYPERIH
ncbi:MAG: amidohydrolase [Lachnospiraceae bacterium]|nr:amidohydrolase [Lachnospiraceae bacterium]